jgi:hypothetical protein
MHFDGKKKNDMNLLAKIILKNTHKFKNVEFWNLKNSKYFKKLFQNFKISKAIYHI